MPSAYVEVLPQGVYTPRSLNSLVTLIVKQVAQLIILGNMNKSLDKSGILQV